MEPESQVFEYRKGWIAEKAFLEVIYPRKLAKTKLTIKIHLIVKCVVTYCGIHYFLILYIIILTNPFLLILMIIFDFRKYGDIVILLLLFTTLGFKEIVKKMYIRIAAIRLILVKNFRFSLFLYSNKPFILFYFLFLRNTKSCCFK